jgi:hypothetical protein
MSNTNTGGPAFSPAYTHESGMTLRDYFAAKAMQAHVQREDVFEAIAEDRITPEKICAGCYAWADAMLKTRDS